MASNDGSESDTKRVTIYDVHNSDDHVRLRQLPTIMAQALRLVWDAARGEFLLVTALQAIGGLGLVLPILAGRNLLSALDSPGIVAVPFLLREVAVLLGLSALISFANSVAFARNALLTERVTQHAQGRILDVTCAVELEAFETPSFHNRLQLATMSSSYRPMQLVQGVEALGSALLGIIGVSLALFALQPLLVPLTLLAAVPLWIAGVRRGKLMFGLYSRLTPAERERGYLMYLLTGRFGAKEVRAFGLAGFLRGRWQQRSDERLGEMREKYQSLLRVGLLGGVLSALIIGAGLTMLLMMAVRGDITLADAGAAAGAVLLLSSRLRAASGGTDLLFEAAPFVEDFNTFVSAAETTVPAGDRRPAPARFERLEVDDVTFTYPSGDRPALSGVSLELEAGQVIALVGENGSGKTTLAKLLCRLYQPQSGRILWDGVDTFDVDADELRRSIAVLFQDFSQYHLSAADNIAIGNCDLVSDRAGIVASAAKAGADGFLTALPDGYDSMLGPEFEGGTDLSVGQWQRVALARAFFRDAPFIILDEPTAALDARAEHELFDRIRTLFAGRAVLLISHRFSTVRSADRIYVLADGRLTEQGTHAELMELGGQYAELFTLQASSYLDPAGQVGAASHDRGAEARR
ncbi:MAG: ABC transporter ATP-binding protein [Egibacteraceae bacterium]